MANTYHLAIQGMHCGACVRRVTSALQGVNGVDIETVTVGSATVRTNDSATAEDALAAIERIGFHATVEK